MKKLFLRKKTSQLDWFAPIAVDKNGKPLFAYFSYFISNEIFGYIALGIIVIFGLSFTFAFYSRNKCKFILLRFMNTRREKLTKGNYLAFSINLITSYLSGIIIASLVICIINLTYSHILGITINVLSFPGLCFLYAFLALLLVDLIIYIMLYFFLARKDLSKQISEIKYK